MNMDPRKVVLLSLAFLFVLIVIAYSLQKAMNEGML